MLKPKELSVEPEAPDASRIFTFWLRTVEDFITCLEECRREDGPAAVNPKRIIISCLSSTIYPYVEEAETYGDIVKTLKELFVKKKNNVYARHLLVSRRQGPGESVTEYLQTLKRLAKDCTFTDVSASAYRDELTRDSFINGLASPSIRQRLLEKDGLTLTQAFELANSLDSAHRHAISIGNDTIQSVSVAASNGLYVPAGKKEDQTSFGNTSLAATRKDDQQSHSPETCFYCGGSSHVNRQQCPARNSTCYHCGKRGHFSRVCRSRATRKECDVAATLSQRPHLASAPSTLMSAVIRGTVAGKPVHVLVDSGASENFIDKQIAKKSGLVVFGKSSAIGMASSQLCLDTLGKVSAELNLSGTLYPNVFFNVLPKLCADVIVGQEFLKLHNSVTFVMNGPRKPLTVTEASPSCPIQLSVAAAKLEAPRLFQFLSPDTKPVASKSLRYTAEDRSFIEAETGRLLASDIIEPSRSPWRAQVLVVKQKEKKRLVVDYSMTINRFTELDAYPLRNIEDLVNEISQDKYYSSLDLRSAYHQVPILPEERPFTAFEAGGRLYQYKRLPFGVTNGVSAFQRCIDNFIKHYDLQKVYAYIDDLTVTGATLKEHDQNLERLLQAAKDCNLTLNESKSVFRVQTIDMLGYRISSKQVMPDPSRLQPLLDLPPPRTAKELKRVTGMFAYYAKWLPKFSEKAGALLRANSFPLDEAAIQAFNELKNLLSKACLSTIQDGVPFVVETDASDYALAAILSQNDRPVAFMSRSLDSTEKRYPAVEKEATAIIEAVRRWGHFLKGRHFTIVTDQQAVSFVFNQKRRGKIKNTKILSWRLELSQLSYDIRHKPGIQNVAPDAFSRVCSSTSIPSLPQLHQSLGHPGFSRMYHFVRQRNLPFSGEETKRVCKQCRTCAEIKPRFFRRERQTLVKAIRPWDRLSIDFKGPVKGPRPYLLIVVDEFSRFPFVFPCKNTSSSSVIDCLSTLFSILGFPYNIHSDRGASFVSHEFRYFLTERGISSTTSSPYHPTGNSQCERINQTVWRTIKLLLHGKCWPESRWEDVLLEALHSIRSLVCLATNETPHERLFRFPRRATFGTALPSWLLNPGTVLLRRFVRNKDEPLCDRVELLEANPNYALIRYSDGRESSVSTSDLAPAGNTDTTIKPTHIDDFTILKDGHSPLEGSHSDNKEDNSAETTPEMEAAEETTESESVDVVPVPLRRSNRIRRPPVRYGDVGTYSIHTSFRHNNSWEGRLRRVMSLIFSLLKPYLHSFTD